MTTDPNKRLPENPSNSRELKYPYYSSEQDVNGNKTVTSRIPGDKGSDFSENYSSTGSYEAVEAHPERGEIRTKLNSGDVMSYTAGGSAVNVDGHMDQSVRSTSRSSVTGDHSIQIGRNSSSFVAGQEVLARGGPQIARGAPGSDTKTYNSSGGDIVNEHTGNYHEAYRKNLVTSITKNAVTMVNEGDYALHVQAGNYDAHIKSKARIYADDDILIESASKITLKVGGSTIVITSSGIDMDAPRIDLN